MAINFAAANMAGYSNPEVKIIPMTAGLGDEVVNPPSYADISNICKHGKVPAIHIALPGSNTAYILQLGYYDPDMFSFCGLVHNGALSEGSTPMVCTVIFRADGTAPALQIYSLPSQTI